MLMAMLGRQGILLVYLSTVTAFSPTFFFGKLLSPRVLTRTLVMELAPLGPDERLRFLL
jgi:hypothetical protein